MTVCRKKLVSNFDSLADLNLPRHSARAEDCYVLETLKDAAQNRGQSYGLKDELYHVEKQRKTHQNA